MIRMAKLSPFVLVLAACLWFLAGTTVVTQKPAERRSLHVQAKQLLEQTGIELRCDEAKLTGMGRIEELSCVIKNNTLAPLVAGTLKTDIIFEEGGKDNIVSNYQTFDTSLLSAVDPDYKGKQIQPGREFRFYQPPTDFGIGIVKQINAEVDFIEFADKSGLGPNNAGSRTLNGMRNGVSKYRNWLAKKHKQNPDAVFDEIVNESDSKIEIGLQSDDEVSGANMYRKHLRKLYKTKGRNEI